MVGHEPRDRVRAEARRLLTAGVAGHVFPGGAAAVSWRTSSGAEELIEACAGTTKPGDGKPGDGKPGEGKPGGLKVAEATRYDLAALTQVFVAAAALRMTVLDGLDLDTPIEALVSDVRGGALVDTSLRSLFWHRGGLAGWGGLYLDVPHDLGSSAARRWILSEAARRPREAPAGAMEESDLGYMIAGEALARAAGVALDEVLERYVLAPLGLSEQICFPGALPTEKRAALARLAAPTERCEWRGRLVQGEPQDENAAALGGVAGHAGLFGTAHAVALFGRAILDSLSGRGDFLPSAVMEQSLAEPPGGGHLRFGWDARHTPACGKRMGPRSFGKLGFTGTSIWCDPDSDAVVVLLTNRVCPSRANEKIDGFRPAFHDGLMAALKS
jgi:CubicO group peptidase (beta-lactamase class C family)